MLQELSKRVKIIIFVFLMLSTVFFAYLHANYSILDIPISLKYLQISTYPLLAILLVNLISKKFNLVLSLILNGIIYVCLASFISFLFLETSLSIYHGIDLTISSCINDYFEILFSSINLTMHLLIYFIVCFFFHFPYQLKLYFVRRKRSTHNN